MEIREIQLEDLAGIAGLSAQLGYSYTPDADTLKILRDSENDRIYGAFDPETSRLTGYIHLQIYRTLLFYPLLNILGIVVDRDCRGRGIGTSLLTAAEEFGRTQGCRGIRANSGSDRLGAHEFYRKRGFVNEKDQKRFVRLFDEKTE